VLILSRDLLVTESGSVSARDGIYRRLAHLTRKGCRLLLTAAEPDRWLPTRGSEDSALRAQNRIQEQLQRQGGDLDGVYYVRRSELTQDRMRQGALRDILGRYAVPADRVLLISANGPFLEAARELVIATVAIDLDGDAEQQLDRTLKSME
jgi:hypothetical protein